MQLNDSIRRNLSIYRERFTLLNDFTDDDTLRFIVRLMAIEDAYFRMATNTDEGYRAKQLARCEDWLNQMTNWISDGFDDY